MKKIKIGILRETKNPPDKRVAITPNGAAELIQKYPNIQLVVQPGKLRCFTDEEYEQKGIKLQEDLTDCDILLGVKEVDKQTFIPGKTYLFFAHVAKQQPYNKDMFKAMIANNITLIDYEYLTRKNGTRLVAFGRWAGIVGAYNGLRARGLRTGFFRLKPAFEYRDMSEMFAELAKITFKNIKIVVTGGGRVAHGAMETLNAAGITKVSPDDFLTKSFNHIVYTQLEPWHYVQHKKGDAFDLQHFFEHPQQYISKFEPYLKVADIFIACHFWDPQSPVFFNKEQLQNPDFNISVIADVSCDIERPIPTTLRASTIAEPFYDVEKNSCSERPPFSDPASHVTVMAIDNLPGELPRDSAEDFCSALINNVFDSLLSVDAESIIENATILKNGQITPHFSHLHNYIK